MLTLLLAPFRVIINFIFGALATAIIGLLVILVGLPKLLLPIPVVQRGLSTFANGLFRLWGYAMSLMFRLTQPMHWHIHGDAQLHLRAAALHVHGRAPGRRVCERWPAHHAAQQ